MSGISSKSIIIIPCYNEEKRLNTTVFLEFLKENEDFDFLFVNDGSVDNTLHVLNNLKKENPRKIHVIDNEENLGKGNSIREGIIYANKHQYHIIGYLDADLATPLTEAKRLIQILKEEDSFVLVLGSRVDKILGSDIKRSRLRWFFSRILSLIFYLITKINAYDTQCGAKFFKKEICEIISSEKFYTRWLFDIEILFRIQNSSFDLYKNCREFPIFYWRDIGDSKLSIFDFYGIFKELLKILKKYRK